METFFTTSNEVNHIIKSFNLTKTLFVSSIIIGEAHTGKKTMARYLFPEARVVSAENQSEVIAALANNDELIITDFEKLTNQNTLDFSNKRIIATANYMGNPAVIDDLFAFIYTMPSLKERLEDATYLRDIFIRDAAKTLMIEQKDIVLDEMPLDLATNTQSLKKSVYYTLVKHTMTLRDINDMLYDYFLKHLEGNDNYREHLAIYERPLIEAGLKKYGSQLQLSSALGINRNTLRKKIHEHNID